MVRCFSQSTPRQRRLKRVNSTEGCLGHRGRDSSTTSSFTASIADSEPTTDLAAAPPPASANGKTEHAPMPLAWSALLVATVFTSLNAFMLYSSCAVSASTQNSHVDTVCSVEFAFALLASITLAATIAIVGMQASLPARKKARPEEPHWDQAVRGAVSQDSEPVVGSQLVTPLAPLRADAGSGLDMQLMSSLMSAQELQTVEAGMKLLQETPMPRMPTGNILAVQLLRFIREHGHNPRKVANGYRNAHRWRLSSLPTMPTQLRYAPVRWLSTREMPNAEWATPNAPIGLHCGFAKSGNPVKIERIGAFDIKTMQQHRDCRRFLNEYYLGLIECLQQRLDQTSLDVGKLQQTYEIFDLKGLGTHMISLTTLNFTRDVLGAFATHYPSSFAKAVVINAPPVFVRAWGFVSSVLPASVKAKVKICGTDYLEELRADLTEEALSWVQCEHSELSNAPRRAGEPTIFEGDDPKN